MVAPILIGLAVLTLLSAAFVWWEKRPQYFADPLNSGEFILFVPPTSARRPTRKSVRERTEARGQVTKVVPKPADVMVPTDMFWDELLGQLCFISEEHVYQASLNAYHEDSNSGVVARDNLTVLLVDDDPLVRRVVKSIMEREKSIKLKVVACSGLLEAVKAIDEDGARPDLLITDVVLNGGTGLLVCSTVRKRFPNLPAIFISGYTNMVVPGERVLGKPFSPNDLLSAVQEAMGFAEYQEESAPRPRRLMTFDASDGLAQS
jgi:CheY-like chemotaxis protein